MAPPSPEFSTRSRNPDMPQVTDVAPEEVLRLSENVTLIDVRQPEEFVGELGHAPGAKLMVLDTLPTALSKLPADSPIVFICRSGGRSARACAFAQANGLNRVYNMKGGMLLWNALHLPVEGRNQE